MTDVIVDIALLALMVATAIAVLRVRNLFAAAMLSGFYSFLAASMFVVLDAVDVAFTEASVGAGISTVLIIAVLALTKEREKIPLRRKWQWVPLAVVVITGCVLLLATPEMPRFADPEAPINLHVVPRYMADDVPQYSNENKVTVGIPNVVTTILASYRGYDTLGETTVIFTAGVAVMLLLGGRRRKPRDDAGEEDAG